MPSVEDAIIEVCTTSHRAMWLAALEAARLDALSETLFVKFDAATAEWNLTDADVTLADSPVDRLAYFRGPGLPGIAAAIVGRLRLLSGDERKAFVAAVNALLDPNHPQSWGSLPKKLARAAAGLLMNPESERVLRRAVVPALWPRLADRYAAGAARIGRPKTFGDSLMVHHLSLMAGELRYTRQPSLKSLRMALEACSTGLLGLRGNLVRLIEEVKLTGVKEPPPPAGPALRPYSIPLSITSWIVRQNQSSAAAFNGSGVASHFLDHNRPSPGTLPRGFSRHAYRQSRIQTFQMYDLTVLAYQLLSTSEHVIRAWAHAAGQNVLTPGGRPKSVRDLTKNWPDAAPVRKELDAIYDAAGPNIRSKLVHGGLLSIESGRQYLTQQLVAQAGIGTAPIYGLHLFSPENTCSLAFELLRAVVQTMRAGNVSLGAGDFGWCALMLPPAADVAADAPLARRMMTTLDSARWNSARDVLSALMPGLAQFATIALIGQIDPTLPNVLERYLAGLLVFEALYRLVAQMYRIDVLQVVPEGHQGDYGIRYQMLDQQQLLSAANLGRVLDGIAPARRADAERWLLLTMHCRNAVVHGAIVNYSGDLADAMAWWLSRSIEVLTESAVHLMARECAYFRWWNAGQPPGTALSDWDYAKRTITKLVQNIISTRRM